MIPIFITSALINEKCAVSYCGLTIINAIFCSLLGLPEKSLQTEMHEFSLCRGNVTIIDWSDRSVQRSRFKVKREDRLLMDTLYSYHQTIASHHASIILELVNFTIARL